MFPLDAKDPRLIVPCIFSPTKWVRRKLTGIEMCKVKDLPDSYTQQFLSGQIANICQDKTLVPMKVVHRMLDALSDHLSQCNNLRSSEGVSSLEDSQQVKYQKLEEKSIVGESIVNRNLSAAKADDAEVPEFLWDQALILEGEWDKRRALKHLRAFTLRWWQANIRRELLKWFFNEHPELRNALHQWTAESPPWHEKLKSAREAFLNWNAGRECISRCCNSTW